MFPIYVNLYSTTFRRENILWVPYHKTIQYILIVSQSVTYCNLSHTFNICSEENPDITEIKEIKNLTF